MAHTPTNPCGNLSDICQRVKSTMPYAETPHSLGISIGLSQSLLKYPCSEILGINASTTIHMNPHQYPLSDRTGSPQNFSPMTNAPLLLQLQTFSLHLRDFPQVDENFFFWTQILSCARWTSKVQLRSWLISAESALDLAKWAEVKTRYGVERVFAYLKGFL